MRAPFAACLFAVAVALGACTDDAPSQAGGITSSMTATVDERGVVMSMVSDGQLDQKYFVRGTTATPATIDAPNEAIILSFAQLSGAGTYAIDGSAIDVYARYTKPVGNGVEEYIATTGSVKVEEFGEDGAKGTFSFRASTVDGSKSVRVTEGRFRTVND